MESDKSTHPLDSAALARLAHIFLTNCVGTLFGVFGSVLCLRQSTERTMTTEPTDSDVGVRLEMCDRQLCVNMIFHTGNSSLTQLKPSKFVTILPNDPRISNQFLWSIAPLQFSAYPSDINTTNIFVKDRANQPPQSPFHGLTPSNPRNGIGIKPNNGAPRCEHSYNYITESK